ncbi:hypothetical protein ACJZ2D_000371 [Fusarium nematophilum]
MNESGPPETANPPGLFSHSHGRCKELFYTSALLPIFVIPVVILRLWTSAKILCKWHVDDTLIVIATTLGVPLSISACIALLIGFITQIAKWCGTPLYCLILTFVKASVLAFYLRFTFDTVFKTCTFALLFIIVSSALVSIVISASSACTVGPGESCQWMLIVQTICSALNVATDAAILLLPFWLLHPMKVPLGRKIAIAFIMMGGGFVLIVSIIGLMSMIDVADQGDPAYALGYSVMWR